MKPLQTSRIFISYSHRGNGLDWKDHLLAQLAVFEKHHVLYPWHDDDTKLGDDWHARINAAMGSARLAVLLLTDEFLKSPFVLQHELPELQHRHKEEGLIVAPILCEKCDWEANPWLASLQIKPREQATPVPLASLSQANRDHVLRQLATEIAIELGDSALAEFSSLGESKTYLDKFPLTRGLGTREETLIGREQELALLDLAFAQPHTAIVSLVAWGGVGKTMLVQHWLQRLQREGWFGARRVYAWSFYSQGTKEDRQASEDTFLAHALEWFGVQCEPTLSPWDKGRLIADAVARERTLLILDGVEPLQYPPGPMGGQLRAPGVHSLLKHLARKANSEFRGQKSEVNNCLCLVTTRESLNDLADFQRREGSPWGSVLRVDLGNLTDEAGAALLHHAGANRAGAAEIKPDDKELLTASCEVDSHALTLNLLGRFLARAHGGDIRRRDSVKFEEADREEQGGTTFKMLAAFENWFANEGDIEARSLTILRLLGLFDRPADEGCIAALRKPPVIVGLTEPLFALKRDSCTGQIIEQPLTDRAWDDSTHFLSDFGLVMIQADANDQELFLDCHPLIREYFGTRLRVTNSETCRLGHCRIYEHLSNSSVYQPENLDELLPLYEAVLHGCAASLFEEAYDVLDDRIRRGAKLHSLKLFGVFGTHLAAVSGFFEKLWTKVVDDVVEPRRQAWLFNEIGFVLRGLGRLDEAMSPFRKGVELAVSIGDFAQGSTYIGNLSELNLALGFVEIAEMNAEMAISFSEQTGDDRRRRRDIAVLADACHQRGNRVRAMECFNEAELIQAQLQPQFPQLYSTMGFGFTDLLLSELEQAAWRKHLSNPASRSGSQPEIANLPLLKTLHADAVRRASNALRLVLGRSKNLQDIAMNRLTLGRCAIYAGIIGIDEGLAIDSLRNIAEAEQGLRRSGTAHHIPRALLSRAWLAIIKGSYAAAQADLEEAWDIAGRGPMRLHLADIHLHRARLFFREKSYPWQSPQADLAAAEKLINDCGYHRRDQELDDAKRAILGL